jgi:hypothetical protein
VFRWTGYVIDGFDILPSEFLNDDYSNPHEIYMQWIAAAISMKRKRGRAKNIMLNA